jgi:hypothetical protein
MASISSDNQWQNLGACGLLLWGGLTIGVAFVATPAKFLATTLTWPGWLDVGRHTFAVYNRVELVIVGALIAISLLTSQRRMLRALILPSIIVLTETLWLIPALDQQVVAFIAGAQRLPSSPLHLIYICAEVVKTAALVFLGGRLIFMPRFNNNAAPTITYRTDISDEMLIEKASPATIETLHPRDRFECRNRVALYVNLAHFS